MFPRLLDLTSLHHQDVVRLLQDVHPMGYKKNGALLRVIQHRALNLEKRPSVMVDITFNLYLVTFIFLYKRTGSELARVSCHSTIFVLDSTP